MILDLVLSIKFCWFVFVSEAFFSGDPTPTEKIENFEKGLESFMSNYPELVKTGCLIGNRVTLADLAVAHRLSIPFIAGYKFEKYPQVQNLFANLEKQSWYTKVNKAAIEMIQNKKIK